MKSTITFSKFNHPEVTIFYEYDLSIPKEEVVRILGLPKKTLVEDMESMIRDCISRDDYFRSLEDKDNGWAFHLHALWVLVELNAKEALPTILELLKQDDNFNCYWFGDYATEDFWEVLYHLGANTLDLLKKITLEPGAWVNRIIPTTTFEQIALHQPEKRTEIIHLYGSILEDFLAMEENDPALDRDVISTIVGDLISLQAKELLPVLKKLYEKGLVFEGIVGKLSSVEKDVVNPTFTSKRDLKASIFERYEDAMTWYGYRMRYDKNYPKEKEAIKSGAVENLSATTTFVRPEKKVGRNQPCPCGSGKKYKRCCLNK